MKGLGALLVMFSGLFLGLWGAFRLGRRERLLTEWKKLMAELRMEMVYSSRPLAQMLGEKTGFPFCRLAAREPNFLFDPTAAMEEAGKALFSSKEDLELYLGFVRGLGTSDTKGQLDHIGLYEAMLAQHLEEAREQKTLKSRLYVVLGLFSGLTLCIVML